MMKPMSSAEDSTGTSCQERPWEVLCALRFANNRKVTLRPGINSIGRLPLNDIIIADLEVSRQHLLIEMNDEGQCRLYDMSSKNGTFLNNCRITEPILLRHGDELQISSVKCTFTNNKAEDQDSITSLNSHLSC